MAVKQPEKENKDIEKMAQRPGTHQAGLGQYENGIQDYQFPDISNIGKKSGKKKAIIILGAVVLLITAFLAVPRILSGGKTAAVNSNFATYKVQRRNITVTLSGSGTLQAADSYTIKSLIDGDIVYAPFEEGQVVKKDITLYKVDSSDVATSIAQAENSLDQSRNAYDQKVKSMEDLDIRSTTEGTIVELEVEAGDTVKVGQTVAVVRNVDTMSITLPFLSEAAKDFYISQNASVQTGDSFEKMNGRISKISGVNKVLDGNVMVREITIDVANPGAMPDAQVATAFIGGIESIDSGTFSYKDEKTITADVSGKVSVMKAKEGDKVVKNQVIAVLSSDAINADIKNAASSLKDTELSLQSRKNQLDNYTITSPIAGTIVEKNYKEGDTLKAGEPLCTIFDLSYLKLVLNVDEFDIRKVKVGQTVKISVDNSEGTEYDGIVMKININGTTVNGVTSYPVTVRIDNAGDLLPGMNVDAKIEVESLKDVLSIPAGIVARNGQVLVKTGEADSGKTNGDSKIPTGYAYKKVNFGGSNDEYIEIVDGLKEGDIVAEIKEASANQQMFGGPGGGPGRSPGQEGAPAQVNGGNFN